VDRLEIFVTIDGKNRPIVAADDMQVDKIGEVQSPSAQESHLPLAEDVDDRAMLVDDPAIRQGGFDGLGP